MVHANPRRGSASVSVRRAVSLLTRILFPLVAAIVAGVGAFQAPAPARPAEPALAKLAAAYLWPSDAAVRSSAEQQLQHEAALRDVTRMDWLTLEEAMRRGPGVEKFSPAPAAAADGRIPWQEFSVAVPHGPDVPVIVQLPRSYRPDDDWPLMFAMHGGPPGRPEQARSGAERMIKVWTEAADRAGWIVAAPALTPSVTAGPRTEQRLPYEVFHPEQAKAVIDAVRARYRINPDRIVSTGISLGSNYSIGFAAARPGWLSAIVPVSTEGDSREWLLRNLHGTPVYVLEGTQDKNIRGIGGPRALFEILTRFGYDLAYREFGDRAHEGFQEHYDDVLRWLDARPRLVYPREVVRVPHAGIMGTDRRVHWIESETRQGVFRATVAAPNRIEITARWTPALTLYLHDRLVNLDTPVQIVVNGVPAFEARVPRSARTALEQARVFDDERRIYASAVRVEIPQSSPATLAAEKLTASLAPATAEGQLSFWEMYAVRALEERFPDIGFQGEEVPLPGGVQKIPERVALRVTTVKPGTPVALAGLRSGDLLVEFGGEPFFAGRGGVSALHAWLMRELRSTPAPYRMRVIRDGKPTDLTAQLKLGPYAS